jgi:hypothetical protein
MQPRQYTTLTKTNTPLPIIFLNLEKFKSPPLRSDMKSHKRAVFLKSWNTYLNNAATK